MGRRAAEARGCVWSCLCVHSVRGTQLRAVLPTWMRTAYQGRRTARRVGGATPESSPTPIPAARARTHAHTPHRLSCHTHYFIHTPLSHVPLVLHCHTKPQTLNTCSHICTTSHTTHHSPPTIIHTGSHPSSSREPFHTYFPNAYPHHTFTDPHESSCKHTSNRQNDLVHLIAAHHTPHIPPTQPQHALRFLTWPSWHSHPQHKLILTDTVMVTPYINLL